MKLQYTVIQSENVEAFRPYIDEEIYARLHSDESYLAIGAISEGKTCGAAVAQIEQNKAYLKSLFIDPAVRRNRFGTMLMQQLLSRLLDCETLEVRYCLEHDARKIADQFFQSIWGGSPEKQSAVYRLTLEETRDTPFFSRFGLGRYTGRNLCRFTELEEEQLQALFKDPNIPAVLNCFYRVEQTKYDLSWALIQNGMVSGYILVNEEREGTISLVAYMEKGSSYGLFPLLGAVSKGVYQTYPPKTILELDCIGEVSEGLARRLLGVQYCVAWTHRHVCLLSKSG